MSELYSRIESLCADRDITITEMCRNSGAPRGSLTDLKKGRTNGLSSSTLSKIAAYFNVQVDSLLTDGALSVDNLDLDGPPEVHVVRGPSLDTIINGAEQKKEPAENDGLPESIQKLIDYARTVPEDQAEMMLQTLKMMAAQADRMKEALRTD